MSSLEDSELFFWLVFRFNKMSAESFSFDQVKFVPRILQIFEYFNKKTSYTWRGHKLSFLSYMLQK